jgi:hypothetical protein
MANKHEAHEPGTKPAFWARSEPGMAWFYAGPGQPGTNKRAGLGQETRHGGLARHDPFTSKHVKLTFFCTKTCFSARLARFRPAFFVLNGPGPFRPTAGWARTENQARGLRRPGPVS